MNKAFFLLLLFIGIAAAQKAGPGTASVYYASKVGATLDCIPSTGLTAAGGSCTNNDAVLNAVLATATASKPLTLIIDGGTITNGLLIPATGYVTIDCQNWGNGFFIAPGANAHVIRNVAGVNGGGGNLTTPGTPGQNVTIRECFINGNRGNGTTGNSNGGNARQATNGNWLFGVFLNNMTHVLIDHNWFYDEPSFFLLLNSCTDCVVSHNRFDAASRALNQDGVHVDGPSSQVRIHDNWFNTSDDAIALNAAEGYGGAIDGVAMSGNQCVGCITAFRLLSNEAGAQINAAVRNITFVNGSGTIADVGGAAGVAFKIGDQSASGGTSDIIRDVKIADSTYSHLGTLTGMVEVDDNVGELTMSNVTWLNPGAVQPWLKVINGAKISNYTCTACTIYRSTAGNAAAFWGQLQTGTLIKHHECNGCNVINQQGQSYAALPYAWDVQSGGSIGTFQMTAMDPSLQPTLLNGNQWSRITSFYGAGVSTYYRNTTYATLPPATYTGLNVSISDSAAAGVWGATETGGSAGHFASLTSNGTNWTVTGK